MAESPLKVGTVRQKIAQNPSLFNGLRNVHHMCTLWMAETKFSEHTHTHTLTHSAEEDGVEHLPLKDTER